MNLKLKLLTCFACGAAFLLGACSGSNPAGTSSGSDADAVDTPRAAARDAVTLADAASLADANRKYATAQTALSQATAAIGTADRAEARRLIDEARTTIDAAVTAAEAAVAAAAEGSAADIGSAARARDRANALRTSLDNALTSFAWYRRALARTQVLNGEVTMPPYGGDGVTVEIKRIPPTIPDPDNPGSEKANPDAITSDKFKDVPYAEGKLVFSVADGAEGGDEFKVDGYTVSKNGSPTIRSSTLTGLKLTGDGIVISSGERASGDFTDTRRDITGRNTGQNGWDLELTFGEPHVTPVARGGGSVSDWMGNGAFHWKSIVPADPRQLETGGVYYDSRSFRQPDGFKDLGTYEVWLSNYLGVLNSGLEPARGSGVVRCPDGTMGTSCPFDDTHHYLKYAAYGLFIYTVDTETFNTGTFNAHQTGRVQPLYFGYSAFADETGKETTDIGTAITGATFTGQTLAYAFMGANAIGSVTDAHLSRPSRLLRGDATLTVSIPKSGSGTIEGDLENFERWTGTHWQPMTSGFEVSLSEATISDGGTFSGGASASGTNLEGRAGTGGTSTAPLDFPTPFDYNSGTGASVYYWQSGGLNGTGGSYKGSFYGPRDDSTDLEVAGSWYISRSVFGFARWGVFGSFAAKQKPAATPGS